MSDQLGSEAAEASASNDPEPDVLWHEPEQLDDSPAPWHSRDFPTVSPIEHGPLADVLSSAFGIKGPSVTEEQRVLEKFVRRGSWIPAPSGWLLLLSFLVASALIPVAWVAFHGWQSGYGAVPTSQLEPVRLLGRPSSLPKEALLAVCAALLLVHLYALGGSATGRRGALIVARSLFLCWGLLFAVLALAPYARGDVSSPVWMNLWIMLLALGGVALTFTPRIRRWCSRPGVIRQRRMVRRARAEWGSG